MAKTVGLIALLVGAVAVYDWVSGPFFSLSTQRWEPERHGDKVIGVAEGHIKSADAQASTLRIASGFLGLDSLSVQVTADTIIGVRGKLGGVGDLDRGQLVRVAYEVASDRLVARRVEVLNVRSTTVLTTIPTPDLGDKASPDPPARTDGVTKPRPIERAAAPPVAVSVPVPSPAPTPPVAPAAPEPTRQPSRDNTESESRRAPGPIEATTAKPAEISELPPRVEVKAPPPAPPVPPVAVPPPPAPSAPPVAAVPRPPALPARRPVAAKPPAPPPADAALPRRDPDDARAVIDWLLNSPPSRSPQFADAP